MDIEGYEKAAITGLRETLRRNRPVVLIETSVDPKVPDIFKSMSDVQQAFPESYDFCFIESVNKSTGVYRLQRIRSMFDQQEVFNLVAWPSEKRPLISQESGGDVGPVKPSSNPGVASHPC